MTFEQAFDAFMAQQIEGETNKRRRERLERGLGHGETELLRSIWYPAIGNFNDLYPEWEVRDYANRYRYLDLAYMPRNAKSNVEVHGYASHARDLEVSRFKDLCLRHANLALDGWLVLPIAYPSIIESPKQCQQLILSLVGKFVSTNVPSTLSWLESEIIRYARRSPFPLTAAELSLHLKISTKHARTLLHQLTDKQLLKVASGKVRFRSYQLNM
ncbi:transcriptional regulator [Paenibacillus oryzisoli]|uniref:Transcriptional regulator n=1 Tax=Paenibacillus oryzisoli TaxID=1850517 RepID=A0A198ADP0_9BACL|nr:transcriptional regulator [Paenibacillus oryzisoli]OAS19068.1 transcriptional regulator [Paenibacillus oryzisoli]